VLPTNEAPILRLADYTTIEADRQTLRRQCGAIPIGALRDSVQIM